MAKEKVLAFIIILSCIIPPGIGFGNKAIQTKQRIIVIDPGHGGTQNGIVSSSGINEKTITLQLAEKIAQQLENRYNVLLTRTQNITISARERIFLANKNKADLFISIHLHQTNKYSAFFYYFDPPESYKHPPHIKDNKWKSHPLLHQAESKKAITSFCSIFSANKNAIRFFSTGAPILLLEGATMPAILIEPLSVLTLPQHPDEIENILTEYAALISKSIDLYFKKNNPKP
ncbi:N-acetylmuramoyl-L-alanine amidase family protein [Desulfobacula toluolica]|uniref:N-acetylmuramoyl-L-alanine amidase n=1 Tax=Desulfobacula toluolica (strain DSM 7467 / Tol2) TaxID=651182 RepID=K0N3B4_DESTT|nr:N-acetylmuramoyl-L-alanine amidase [Desulfobacula toluolica]CCK78604.1 AmiA: putative N-acetylmuramoyl-L-alanine amidase [Desulfobacula toluolica Tol2]